MRTVASGGPKKDEAGQLDANQRKWLDQFVRGVNLYVAGHGGKLPVEFSLLEYQPEPFTIDDVLGIFLALAWESSPAAGVDPVMARIMGKLGRQRALELLPYDPAASPAVEAVDLGKWEPAGILFSRQAERPESMRVPGFRGGCAWAVGPQTTTGGYAATGCMVYQMLAAPGFWYRARLVAGDFHLAGAFVPGLPAAIAGSNGHVAWGCVSSPVDDADLFVEKLDADPPQRYWRIDRWRNLREIKETYRVKGGRSVSRSIFLTETGPLVSEVHQGTALSLRWVGRDGLDCFPALYALNRARKSNEIRSALKILSAPSLNVAWAEEEGGYGIQLAGRVPVRPPGSDGIFPMPAWTAVHDWRGFIPFDELPSLAHHSGAPVAVADGRPGGDDHPLFISCYWNDRSRTDRINEILRQGREDYRESFQKIQTDVLSPLARDMTPTLVQALAGKKIGSSYEEKAIQVLRSWDFQVHRESAGGAIFALFYQSLLEQLFLASLGDNCYRRFIDYDPLAERMVRKIFLEGRTDWLGDAPSQEVLRRSFKEAVNRGRSLMGGDPAKWKWGEIHRMVFRHPLTDRSRFLEMLYHVGPFPMPGSLDTIDWSGWSKTHPFHVVAGVSLRQICEMSRPPDLAGISPMGSSAHFFSGHYKDQTQAWAHGRSFKEPLVTAEIRQTGINTVVFSPSGTNRVSQR
jgi:penicillin amidase